MKIHIPTPLRQYTEKQSTIEVQAATVVEYGPRGLDLIAKESDSLSIVPSIAGGSGLKVR